MNTNLKKMIQHSIQKELLFKSIKIALAALISIAIAGELGLKYSATAGIITVLSIQNTKKETLRSAMNRALAFACALILAAGAYTIMGFTIPAFAVYLLLFALLCLNMGWAEAISMDSVLITHFLTEQNMASLTILNEVLLFIIGVGMGILVNLHLHRRQDEFERLAAEVDEQDTHQIIVIGVAAIVPHNAMADSLMDDISLFIEENTEAEIIDIEDEIR